MNNLESVEHPAQDQEVFQAGVPPDPAASQPRVWGLLMTVLFGFLIAGVWLAAQVAGLFLAVPLYRTFLTGNVRQLSVSTIANSGFALSIATITAALISVPFILGIAAAKKGSNVNDYFFFYPLQRRHFVWIFAVSPLFVVIMDLVSVGLGRPLVPEVMVQAYNTSGSLLLFLVALVIAAPAVEETFFRGFFFEGLRRSRVGTLGAVAVTSVLWVVIHLQYGLYEWIMITVLGVLLAVARLKTKSLWVCYGMHAFLNLIATIETVVVAMTSSRG